jgi:DNA-binding transcriptional MerR regulator
MIYTPSDLIKHFNRSKETIREWSNEFAEYLSPSARPTRKGGHRLYTDEDFRVLGLVADMKGRGIIFDEIHLALKNGQRGELPDSDTSLMTVPQQQIAMMQVRLLELEDEVERLQGFETAVIAEKALRERAEQEIEAMRRRHDAQLAQAHAEIARLNREIGRLEKPP